MPGHRLISLGSRWSGPQTAVTSSEGGAVAYVGPVPDGQRWTIDTIQLSSTSTEAGSLAFYVGDPLPQNLRGGSSAPIADTWSGTFDLESSETLTFVWSAMGNAAAVVVNVHFAAAQVGLVPVDRTIVNMGGR